MAWKKTSKSRWTFQLQEGVKAGRIVMLSRGRYDAYVGIPSNWAYIATYKTLREAKQTVIISIREAVRIYAD